MSKQITLYDAESGSPYAHRAEMALIEAKAEYTVHGINLQNKPEWYIREVNPVGKVPAITYGGPVVPPEQPSPEAVKITESMIIVEFIADIYPDAPILPKDPVERAKARFFVEAISKLITAWIGALRRGEPFEEVVKSLDFVQNLLPDSEKETYAIGDFSIADIAGAPFFGILLVMFEVDHAALGEGTGRKMYETLQTDPKYAKLKKYINTLKNRESFKAVFNEESVKAEMLKRSAAFRESKKAA